jgi:hypothetical protein
VNTPGAGVVDHRGLAVHDPLRTHDLAAEGLADALMAQAHAQQRDLRAEVRAPRPPTRRLRSACRGPGEMTMHLGRQCAISGDVISSLRMDLDFLPSSPGTARG